MVGMEIDVAVVSGDEGLVARISEAAGLARLTYQTFTDGAGVAGGIAFQDFRIAFLDLEGGELIHSIERLKSHSPWTMVVPIARRSLAEEEFRVRQLGIHYYLTLPFDAEELSALLSGVLGDETAVGIGTEV